ncbi:MAG: extracellular solute-binding protein [Paenibacillus sp.]|nr:extracellular solute-binding protein [Paenibacillus sp.]
MKTKRSTSRSRIEQMIVSLRDDILTEHYPVGSYLPSEMELCQQFQLSKVTVRKGLEVLVGEGYIEKVPRIGAKVIRTRNAEAITIKFGYYKTTIRETHILKLVHTFQQQYPNIQIQPVAMHFPRNREGITTYIEESKCDVMMLNHYDYEILDSAPVEEYLEPLEMGESTYPYLNKPFTTNQSLYVRPFVFTPVVLCYNKDHFNEMRLPEPDGSWTWDDVKEACSKIANANDRYGLYFHLLSDNRWPLFLLQNKVFFQKNEEGKYELRSDEKLKQGLRTCMELISDKTLFPTYFSEDEDDVETLFLKQKVSMIIATYSTLNSLGDASFTYDISPLPSQDEASTLLVVIGIAVTRGASNKQAAKLFQEYLVSYDTQLYIRQHTLSIPAMKLAAEWSGEERMVRPSRFQLYREVMNTFHYYTDLNLTCYKLAAMRNELKFYWSGLDSLDTVLERIERKLENM